MTGLLNVFCSVERADWIVRPSPIRNLTRDDRPLIWVAIDPDNVTRVIEGLVPIARAKLAREPSGGYMPAIDTLNALCAQARRCEAHASGSRYVCRGRRRSSCSFPYVLG